MLSPSQINRLKSFISKDDAKNAISNIFEILDSIDEEQKIHVGIKAIYNDLVIISGNQNNLLNESRRGLISREQYNLENNRINNAIISLVDSLDGHKLDVVKNSTIGKRKEAEYEFDVFLCFSSKDIIEAREIWEQLTKSEMNVFMSDEALKFEAGISFMERIEFALENSKNFVFLCTDNSLSSEWVKIEYQTFLSEFYVKDKINRKLIVQKGKTVLNQKIPLLLRRLQFSESINSTIKSISSRNELRTKKASPKDQPLPIDKEKIENKSDTKDLIIKSTTIGFPSTHQLTYNLPHQSIYIPSNSLIEALNIAVSLGQPLLLSGEPGVGKTQFVHHVSRSLGWRDPCIFNAKSTSVIKDLFYRYDEKRHLYFAQTRMEDLSDKDIEERFISYVALGAAIKAAIKEERRSVVLIDEIDKAPRDFPNDSLDAIEGLSFSVPEIGLRFTIAPEKRPIIIITTNSEKSLPDAFLSRCIYYHIPFPSNEQLYQILKNRFCSRRDDDFLISVLELFSHFRDKSLRKKPSIGELIAWIETLISLKVTDIEKKEQSEKLLNSLSVIFKTVEDLNMAKEMVLMNKTGYNKH